MTRVHTGFSSMVPDGDWPRPHGWGRPERLGLPLETLQAVGPSLAKKLRPLGLSTIGDLLYRRPRRYEPAADEVAISQLWGDQEVAIAGVVKDVRLRRPSRRLTIVTAHVADATGSISATWFNQPWLLERLRPGTEVRLRGKLGRHGFDVKSYDLGEARATADYAPVYGASEQVPSIRLRELVRAALAAHVGDVLDPLPAELDLPIRRDALAALHFPADPAEAERARRRLALDELVALQLAVLRSRGDEGVGTPLGDPASSSRGTGRRCPSSSPSTRNRRSTRSTAILLAPCRCSASSRATSARGRRSSPCTPCCARSRRDARARSWCPPRRSPSSTS